MKVQDVPRSELLSAVRRYRESTPALPANWEGDFAAVIANASPAEALRNAQALGNPAARLDKDLVLLEEAPGATLGEMQDLARSEGRRNHQLARVMPWVVWGSLAATAVCSVAVPTPLAGGILVGCGLAVTLGAAAVAGHARKKLDASLEVQSRLLPWETILGEEFARAESSRRELEEMAGALSAAEVGRILQTPDWVNVGGVLVPVKQK
ncbi:MAG: hypothetical protein HY319_06730 [Armatimonadetes bacterium]|nr:hypothetical protein [Armatimonadota bacterium]